MSELSVLTKLNVPFRGLTGTFAAWTASPVRTPEKRRICWENSQKSEKGKEQTILIIIINRIYINYNNCNLILEYYAFKLISAIFFRYRLVIKCHVWSVLPTRGKISDSWKIFMGNFWLVIQLYFKNKIFYIFKMEIFILKGWQHCLCTTWNFIKHFWNYVVV